MYLLVYMKTHIVKSSVEQIKSLMRPEASKEDKYNVALLCGGRGSRLEKLIGDNMPKPLFKIANKELISYSIELFNPNFVDKLIFAVDHKSEAIVNWAESVNLPYNIEFSTQTVPGVLEAIREASKHAKDRFIFCNSDEIRLNLDIRDVIKSHERSGFLATVIGGYTNELHREAVLDMQKNNLVTSVRFRDEQYKQTPEVIHKIWVK